MAKLLEMNLITSAAAWLIERTGDGDITPRYLVEQCRLGEIKIVAATPEWKDIGDGEIKLMKQVSATDPQMRTTGIVIADGKTWINDTPLVSVGNFVSDGLLLVTSEMAARLLTHGKSSLSCARLKIVETSKDKIDEAISLGQLTNGELIISDEQLVGSHDGRMIDFSHLRISKSELEAFAARQGPANQKPEPIQQPAVESTEIRKRKALICEVERFWPSIETDLSDSVRNGLHRAAKHQIHGFWKIQAALIWAHQRGKITKEQATAFANNNPESLLSPMLRQLLKLD